MLSKTSLIRVITFLMPSLFCVSVVDAQPVSLASHRAVYDLTLAEVKEGGGIESVRGRIIMDIDNTCAGYIVNQRMLIELGNVGGGNIISDFNLSTWEDLSGNIMRFTVLNSLNGRIVEKADGIATMEKSEGEVVFSDKESKPLSLPKGVMFPTSHTKAIVEAALSGKNLMAAKVYDGSGRDGLQDSLTVIGRMGISDLDILADTEMANMSSWPVQLSFFDLKKQTNEPAYEVSLRMHQNGVGTNLVLKYKDFSMNGKLVNLELKKSQVCN
ncbi:hypothetical protein A9Q83_14715 [Alphaproteobacteria bacterium 46_93_T64]|nr:hypothetical protein A9Q83_14715 [Alphaproteobacteria bacterium 46_93_T64]